jgi:hypothetical protein
MMSASATTRRCAATTADGAQINMQNLLRPGRSTQAEAWGGLGGFLELAANLVASLRSPMTGYAISGSCSVATFGISDVQVLSWRPHPGGRRCAVGR